MVRGIDKTAADFDEPLVAGLAVLGVKQAGKVAFHIVRVAFRAASDVGLHGPICPRLQGHSRHLAMMLDERGNNFGASVVDALGGIAIDQQAKRIVPGELGDLGLGGLPAVPKPALVMVVSE